MNLTEIHKQMLKGKICPYCKNKSNLVSSTEIYNKDFGYIYLCRPCDAYVGCHKNTTNAKGRLANKELRELKKEAHKYFDMIWRDLQILSRDGAYKWLSDMLDLPSEYTHIGMMGVDKCKEVIYFSKQLLNDNRRLDLDFGVEPQTEFFEI
jgi:hypothetical protein